MNKTFDTQADKLGTAEAVGASEVLDSLNRTRVTFGGTALRAAPSNAIGSVAALRCRKLAMRLFSGHRS
jgi:hypothetical protein